MNPLLPQSDAGPFHEGERAMQSRAGVRERLAQVGPRVMRDHMPEQHRDFFRQLPFIVAGNAPGFVDSPDPRSLTIAARPDPANPFSANLAAGAAIGLLGIEPHSRRRNRMNGVVAAVGANGFTVEVQQSFGNCPQYIQSRTAIHVPGPASSGPASRSRHLDAAARDLIAGADTFFIASAHPLAAGQALRTQGVDVSHRGGRPGFVRIDPDGTLTVPDFSGNFYFNTLGNLTVNPQAGLLFADFGRGDLLQVSAAAEIIWEGAELASFAGAQRLLRLHVREMLRFPGAMPLRFGQPALSPHLARTGHW
jgi:predicted pyridoxine 5'-phosphate oxidase superfamily flavin-nucleotide-binding protein